MCELKKKIFYNIIPEDIPVLRKTKRKLIIEDKRFYLKTILNCGSLFGKFTPSGKYCFITDMNYNVYLSRENEDPNLSTHLGLSQGNGVFFAGEINFTNSNNNNRGKIKFWNNHSGHFLPDEKYNGQANLPLEFFKSGFLQTKGE